MHGTSICHAYFGAGGFVVLQRTGGGTWEYHSDAGMWECGSVGVGDCNRISVE